MPPAVLAPLRELDEPHHLLHVERWLPGLLARSQPPLTGHDGSPPRDALPHFVLPPQPDELRVAERRPHELQARIGPGGRAERGPEPVKVVPHQLRAEHAVRRRGLIVHGTDIGGQVAGRQAPLPRVVLLLRFVEVVRRPAGVSRIR